MTEVWGFNLISRVLSALSPGAREVRWGGGGGGARRNKPENEVAYIFKTKCSIRISIPDVLATNLTNQSSIKLC